MIFEKDNSPTKSSAYCFNWSCDLLLQRACSAAAACVRACVPCSRPLPACVQCCSAVLCCSCVAISPSLLPCVLCCVCYTPSCSPACSAACMRFSYCVPSPLLQGAPARASPAIFVRVSSLRCCPTELCCSRAVVPTFLRCCSSLPPSLPPYFHLPLGVAVRVPP